MRFLYSLIFLLLLPLILLRLYWKGRQLPAYRQHIGERLGFYPSMSGRFIWLHAVSVGETRAAAPLVRQLQQRYPEFSVLLTQMTPTGRETAQQLFGNSVTCVYLPYDLPWIIRRFLRHFRPAFGILMETEIWPNLIQQCRQANVPLYLANARLSERSAKGYARLQRLVRPAFAGLTRIAAQTAEDAQRLAVLGANQPLVCGNIKFDVSPPPDLAQQSARLAGLLGENRQILLWASTREGEEEQLLDAFQQLQWPDLLLLLIVPRHPQRFDDVANQIHQRGLSLQKRSAGLPIAASTRAVLGDSMGEMFAYFSVADVAIIGGSIQPLGGQNLIEACAVGTPVLFGPHMFNFAEASRLALEAGAAQQADSADELLAQAHILLQNLPRRQQMGFAGIAFSQAHRGATERIIALLPNPQQL
jgi:3-deoxy-D-manno-octulosonic-acid transferase